jgi:hypothetical protein
MAKPLGAKSLLIRDAIKANPDLGNKAIAEKLMDSADRRDDKIKVTPQDIAQQKQAMKSGKATPPAPKAATPTAALATAAAPAKRGRPKGKGGRPKKTAATVAPSAATKASTSPVDLIDMAFALADECGGLSALRGCLKSPASCKTAA